MSDPAIPIADSCITSDMDRCMRIRPTSDAYRCILCARNDMSVDKHRVLKPSQALPLWSGDGAACRVFGCVRSKFSTAVNSQGLYTTSSQQLAYTLQDPALAKERRWSLCARGRAPCSCARARFLRQQRFPLRKKRNLFLVYEEDFPPAKGPYLSPARAVDKV